MNIDININKEIDKDINKDIDIDIDIDIDKDINKDIDIDIDIDKDINKNKCFSCRKSFDYQFDQFYKNKFNDLYNIFANTIIGNIDIIRIIFSYIGYYKHTVKYQLKQRIFPPFDLDENEDFDDEVYWYEKKTFCTFCFQNGIISCIKSFDRLPFCRRHIYMFVNPQLNLEKKLIEYQSEYDNFYYNYDLPLFYNITYYRKEQPIKINNKYIITST